MNRRQRRQMSKNLGIMAYQQKLPRAQKFELIRQNIEEGKKMHEEFVEKNRVAVNSQIEQVDSEAVFHLAENISKRKSIPVMDAMKEAQEEYEKQKR